MNNENWKNEYAMWKESLGKPLTRYFLLWGAVAWASLKAEPQA